MGKIPVHKEVNRLPINFENENVLNVFGGLLKEFSKGEFSNIKEFTKHQLWNIAFPELKFRESDYKILVGSLSKSYSVKTPYNSKIRGSIFIVEEFNGTDIIKIEIPQTYLKYFFSQKDINLMSKAKKKERMTTEELDYWDTILRDKKKELLLLEEAELRGIRGKYAKRFYMLLKQFVKTGYFCMNISEFREVMEVPEAYSIGAMNKEVVKRAKDELQKKKLFQFEDEPKGKGRRKIDKIEIKFTSLMEDIPIQKKGAEKIKTEDYYKILADKKDDLEPEILFPEFTPIEFTLEEERKAMDLMILEENISESFIREMKNKNYRIYLSTLKSYLNRVRDNRR